MAVAKTREGPLTIVGGPRYKHRGVVMTVEARGNVKKIDPHPWKVCVYNQLRLVDSLKRQCDAQLKKNTGLYLSFILSLQYQSGEYFGAEVCAMDVDRDSFTDLVFISAPMFVDTDREGRVYICELSGLVNDSFIQCH